MDLDELRTVRRTEREKDSLQHLRDSFYQDVAAYLADLEARRDRAAAEAENPFASQEVRKLTDKIETAEEVSEAIYERRVGKIVKQASFAAADMSADRGGLTEQETALFDDLVERIKQNKTTVLDILAGEGDAGDAADAPTDAPDPVSSDVREAEAADPIPAGVDESVSGDSASSEATPESSGDAGGMLADAMGGEDTGDPVAPADNAGSDAAETAPGTADATETAPGTADTTDTAAETAQTVPEDSAAPAAPASETDADTPDPSMDEAAATPVATADDGDASARGAKAGATGLEDTGAGSDGDAPGDDDASADPTPTTDGGATQLERTTVRITRDVGSILGVDEREYDLEREDVVTLPATNADPLVERDAAERLE